jgi:uncharacterized protein (DUF1499 family)
MHACDSKSLQQCPDKPNCVSTQSVQESQKLEPINLSDANKTILGTVKTVIQKHPRTTLVEERDCYLHYEFRSKLFKFVDDVEFLWDKDENKLHFRSASRLGYYDMGVNKKRMIQIREEILSLLENKD